MNSVKALLATGLFALSMAAQAALIPVKTFADDTAVNNAKRSFYATYTIAAAGEYIFDVIFTANNNKVQGAMLNQVASAGNWQNLSFTSSVNAAGKTEYFSQYKFTATANSNFQYLIGFNPSNGATGKLDINLSQVTAPVPEPETYALMGMGLIGLLAARRRKMKQAA